MRILTNKVFAAVKRCKGYTLTVFITYCLSCGIGIYMVHSGNNFALNTRDRIVGKALQSDNASINYQKGNNLKAALYDFSGNLLIGAIPQTLLGLGIFLPYISVTGQGWVGGIVSVDSAHNSRLKSIRSALYYLLVLLFQFIPYSLSIGAGIKCGVGLYKYNSSVSIGWSFWKFRFKKSLLEDVALVYLLVIPIFLMASVFEFFSTWNG